MTLSGMHANATTATAADNPDWGQPRVLCWASTVEISRQSTTVGRSVDFQRLSCGSLGMSEA